MFGPETYLNAAAAYDQCHVLIDQFRHAEQARLQDRIGRVNAVYKRIGDDVLANNLQEQAVLELYWESNVSLEGPTVEAEGAIVDSKAEQPLADSDDNHAVTGPPVLSEDDRQAFVDFFLGGMSLRGEGVWDDHDRVVTELIGNAGLAQELREVAFGQHLASLGISIGLVDTGTNGNSAAKLVNGELAEPANGDPPERDLKIDLGPSRSLRPAALRRLLLGSGCIERRRGAGGTIVLQNPRTRGTTTISFRGTELSPEQVKERVQQLNTPPSRK